MEPKQNRKQSILAECRYPHNEKQSLFKQHGIDLSITSRTAGSVYISELQDCLSTLYGRRASLVSIRFAVHQKPRAEF